MLGSQSLKEIIKEYRRGWCEHLNRMLPTSGEDDDDYIDIEL